MTRRIFFVHIPKTGGTSLEHLLRQAVGEENCCPYYSENDYVLNRHEPYRHYRVYYGHLFYLMRRHLGHPLYTVTIIREPVSRVVSVYRELLANPESPHGAHILKHDLSVAEWMMDPEQNNHGQDHQTRFLGADYDLENRLKDLEAGKLTEKQVNWGFEMARRSEVDENTLKRAKEALDSMDFCTVTEALDEAVPALFRRLDLPVPESVPRLKATASYERREDKDVLNETDRQRILDLNRHDQELYEYARGLYARRHRPGAGRKGAGDRGARNPKSPAVSAGDGAGERILELGPLRFIIAGYEHSGTTLVSEIFRQAPHLDSGFECGFLLKDRPAEFKGFQPFYRTLGEGWGITRGVLDRICAMPAWGPAYSLLMESASKLADDTEAIFDKTPRYMMKIDSILEKWKSLRAIVLVRDFRSLMYSTYRRSGRELADWLENGYPRSVRFMSRYIEAWERLSRSENAGRALLVRYEDLCTDTASVCERMFEFVGMDFKPRYTRFGDPRFSNVYGRGVDPSHLYKFDSEFDQATQDRIRSDFERKAEWFSDH